MEKKPEGIKQEGKAEQMTDSIHCIKKTLRLKPAEAEVLASKAAEVGMCEVGYLRLLITQKPYDYPETRKLLKKVYPVKRALHTVNTQK